MFKKHEWTFLHYRYSQPSHTFRVWRVVILLMRAKYVGPARVNTQFQGCAMRIFMQSVHYTLHIQHIYFYRHSVYNEAYNQGITDYLYNLHICIIHYRLYRIQNTHKLYALCEACSVYAKHNKYIVEVLEKNVRSTKFIDQPINIIFVSKCLKKP